MGERQRPKDSDADHIQKIYSCSFKSLKLLFILTPFYRIPSKSRWLYFRRDLFCDRLTNPIKRRLCSSVLFIPLLPPLLFPFLLSFHLSSHPSLKSHRKLKEDEHVPTSSLKANLALSSPSVTCRLRCHFKPHPPLSLPSPCPSLSLSPSLTSSSHQTVSHCLSNSGVRATPVSPAPFCPALLSLPSARHGCSSFPYSLTVTQDRLVQRGEDQLGGSGWSYVRP